MSIKRQQSNLKAKSRTNSKTRNSKTRNSKLSRKKKKIRKQGGAQLTD